MWERKRLPSWLLHTQYFCVCICALFNQMRRKKNEGAFTVFIILAQNISMLFPFFIIFAKVWMTYRNIYYSQGIQTTDFISLVYSDLFAFFFFGFQKLENFSLEEFNFMSVNSGYWLQCMPVKLANMSHTELLYKNKVFINLQYWSILQNNYCKLLFQIQWYNKRCTWVTDSQNIPLCETDGQNKC